MARSFILKVTKVTYSPNAPWMVRIPPGLWQLEGQKKKFFDKESVAKSYKERLGRLMVNYQLQAAALTDAQRLEAHDCFGQLEPLGVTLRAAVEHYIGYLSKAGKSVALRQLVEEFLAAKKQDGVSRRYVADLKSKLGRFALSFGERLVCDITSQQLDEWLRSLDVNVISRDAYRRNLGVMFELARRRGYCAQNVAAEIRFSKRHKDEVTVLSPRQIARLLQVCSSELVPYIAICAFAGLRPSEAERLDWRDIHLEAGQIEVKARNAKTRRHRLVPIQRNLKEWLSLYRRNTGRVIFSRRKFRDAYRKAGFVKWPLDVMRHSFGTYRLPILKSAEALALEMGNSPDVIFRHYRRVTDDATADAYFRISPADRLRPAFTVVSDTHTEVLSKNVIDSSNENAPAALERDRCKAA